MPYYNTPLLVLELLICLVLCPRILIIPAPSQLNMACRILRYIISPPFCYTIIFRYLSLTSKPVARIFWKHPKELTVINPKRVFLLICNILAKLIQDLVKSITSNKLILEIYLLFP
jgi:hypothetical protein